MTRDDMKDWIKQLCPEIAGWQVDLIVEQVDLAVAAEREACALIAESYEPRCDTCPSGVSTAIRARGA
jgi:hypothetical protein